MRAAPLALVVLAVATACSEKQARPQVSCAKEAIRAQNAPLSRPLHGDVDGDGHADAIAIVSAPDAREGCRFFVAVHSRGRAMVTPVYQAKPNDEATAFAPVVALLASIDRQPGLEIIALTGHGASSSQFAIFTGRDGVVVKLNCATCDRGGDFFEDHALMHFATVDCVRPGGGVIAQLYGENVIRSDRWSTEVRIYRVDDDVFRLALKRRLVTRAASYAPPFANCAGVRLQ
jgi:hypothetical protein